MTSKENSSPETQASNAGAAKGCIGYMPDYQAAGDCVNCGRIREDHAEFQPATLTTPEPQTGERDTVSYSAGFEAGGRIERERGDDLEELLEAERAAREAAMLAIDGIRAVAATASKHRGNIGKEAEFLAVILTRAEAALIGEVRKHPDHVEAERRLVEEVEMHRYTEKRRQDWQAEASKQNERAEAAEHRLAEVERAERARLFDLFERDPEQFTALCASDAALRAKPEAEAIVGKEAGE